jgi:hypothetical protein
VIFHGILLTGATNNPTRGPFRALGRLSPRPSEQQTALEMGNGRKAVEKGWSNQPPTGESTPAPLESRNPQHSPNDPHLGRYGVREVPAVSARTGGLALIGRPTGRKTL